MLRSMKTVVSIMRLLYFRRGAARQFADRRAALRICRAVARLQLEKEASATCGHDLLPTEDCAPEMTAETIHESFPHQPANKIFRRRTTSKLLKSKQQRVAQKRRCLFKRLSLRTKRLTFI